MSRVEDNPQWESDDSVTNCRQCAVKFTLIKRKHHCRSCLRIFCSDCSNLSIHLSAESKEKERACHSCYLRYHEPSEAPVWKVVARGVPSLLSLSGYRMSLIQEGAVVQSIHVFSVVSISLSGCKLIIQLEPSESGGAFRLGSQTQEVITVVTLEPHQIVDAYKAMCELDFIDMYRAWCDYFFTPPDPTLLQEIIDRVAQGNRALDLTTLPGAQAQHLALDLRPLARALKNNTYFTSLIMHALHRKDAVSEMVDVMETNRALVALRFSAMPNAWGLERLGTLLERNVASRLCSLDLSHTPLAAAAQSLASCLPRMRFLNFSQCSLSDRELKVLMPALGDELQVLNLSGNRFGPESSDALAKRVASCSKLERLVLVECTLRVESLFDAKFGVLGTLANLVQLDISGNSMRNFGGQYALQAVSLIAMLTRLEEFGMRDTQADPIQVVVPILSLMLSNQNISVGFDVSGCAFGPPGAALELQKGLRTAVSHSLRALDLSRINVTPAALRDILMALVPSEHLDTLCVNQALHAAKVTHKEGRALARMFATLAQQKPLLKTLRCAGLGQEVILPMLQEMSDNATLLELDISSNRLGDVGATVVALFIRLNKSIEALELDDNNVSLSGFLAIRNALVSNRQDSALKYMHFPWTDYDRVAPPPYKVAARSALLEVRDILTLKRGNEPPSQRFRRYQPGTVLHDVVVPDDVAPMVPERDDQFLPDFNIDEAGEAPPLPCPVEQHEDIVIFDRPQAVADQAVRRYTREHAQNVAMGRGDRVHVTDVRDEGQVIGNALWRALNNRRAVLGYSDDEGDEVLNN